MLPHGLSRRNPAGPGTQGRLCVVGFRRRAIGGRQSGQRIPTLLSVHVHWPGKPQVKGAGLVSKSTKAQRSTTKPGAQPRGRPSFPKSSPQVLAAFENAIAGSSSLEVRKVFGYPCAFLNGHMTVGVHGNDLFVRLPETDQVRAFRQKGFRHLEPMPGRPMKDYVVLPASLLSSREKLRGWVEAAVRHTAALPPKKKPAGRAASGKG